MMRLLALSLIRATVRENKADEAPGIKLDSGNSQGNTADEASVIKLDPGSSQ